MNNKLHEVCFTGVIDSISAKDVDISLLVEILDVNVVKGSYGYSAPSDHDYNGYFEMDMQVVSGVWGLPGSDFWLSMNKEHLDGVVQKYEDIILDKLWDIVDASAEDFADDEETWDNVSNL